MDKQKEGMGVGSKLLRFVLDAHAEKGCGVVLGTSNGNLSQGFLERKCGMTNLSKDGGQRVRVGERVIENYWFIHRPSLLDHAEPPLNHMTNASVRLTGKICRSLLDESLRTI